MKLAYKTRGDSDPQGKPRVYFTAHPADYEPFFQSIADDILKFQSCNCAIYFDKAPEKPASPEELKQLAGMQLIVVPVTRRFLTEPNRAREVELPFVLERKDPIPVLPLMQEPGLEDLFNEKFGTLQTIGRDDVVDQRKALAGKVQSYEEKLESHLNNILIGDELITQIRAAFDAYIFLSYRKVDRDDAQKLMRLIHSNDFCRDIAIWYDEFLVPGENFNKAIEAAMKNSHLFVLSVTPNLLERSPDGKPNYVMETEYPHAREIGKPVFPVMMKPTNQETLRADYEGIPACADPQDTEQFREDLLETVKKLAIQENDHDPRHNFFIGLAYLSGIDVEKDADRALELITGAAEAGLPEAFEKLTQMYRTGNGVKRDYRKGIEWQEKLVNLYCQCVEADEGPQTAKDLTFASMILGNYCMELPDFSRARAAYLMSLRTCQSIIKVGRNAEKELSEPPQNLPPDPVEFMQSTLWADAARAAEKFLPVCYDNLGDACRELGELEEAKSCYENSLRIDRQVCREDPSEGNLHDLFLILQRLGDLCQRTGDTAGAAGYYQELEALTGTGLRRRDEMLAYNKRGDECLLQNDMAQAEVYFRKQYALAQKLYDELQSDESREDLSACCGRIAQVCWTGRRLEEAEEYARRELALAQEWLENSKSWPAAYQVSIGYEHLGFIAWLKNQVRESEDQFLECLTLRRRLYAQNANQQILMALVNVCRMLMNLLLDQKRFKAARSCGIEMFDAAKEAGAEAEMDEAAYGLYRLAESWQAVAADLVNERRYEEARDALVEVRELGQFLSEEVGRPIRDGQGQEIPLRRLAAMIQWNLRVVYLNLDDLPRALQAGYRCGDLFTKLWKETGDITYGENAARSWRSLASLYEEPKDIELRAYYAQQAAAVCNELYRKTGNIQYLSLLAGDLFQVGSSSYNQGKWQEAFDQYQQALNIQNKYCDESGDRSPENLILACKCAYFMGHASWELKNHEDAKLYLGYALRWARSLGGEPDGYCLPHRSIAITCNRLSLLAEEDKDWEMVSQYAWLSYNQWKQAAAESQDANDWENLAVACSRIAMGQRDSDMAREAYSIWAQLARSFPDEPLYAEQRDGTKEIWEILMRNNPGS